MTSDFHIPRTYDSAVTFERRFEMLLTDRVKIWGTHAGGRLNENLGGFRIEMTAKSATFSEAADLVKEALSLDFWVSRGLLMREVPELAIRPACRRGSQLRAVRS
jgi:hypothetical protein